MELRNCGSIEVQIMLTARIDLVSFELHVVTKNSRGRGFNLDLGRFRLEHSSPTTLVIWLEVALPKVCLSLH